MVIIHRPGRAHSNVDPLSRLPRIPTFISPARKDLPEPSLTTEHEELQQAWQSFIKECEWAVEAKTVKLQTMKGDNSAANQEPRTNAQADEQANEVPQKSRLHVYANEETVK